MSFMEWNSRVMCNKSMYGSSTEDLRKIQARWCYQDKNITARFYDMGYIFSELRLNTPGGTKTTINP